jgi:hypothetical protein
LNEVDRLGGTQSSLDEIAPGLGVERLVLPQRRPGNADVGPGDDDAIDVPTDSAAGCLEAELLAITAVGAKI